MILFINEFLKSSMQQHVSLFTQRSNDWIPVLSKTKQNLFTTNSFLIIDLKDTIKGSRKRFTQLSADNNKSLLNTY